MSKLLSAKKEKLWEPGINFFMSLIDMNQTCLVFMLYVDYGFNNKHTLHKHPDVLTGVKLAKGL